MMDNSFYFAFPINFRFKSTTEKSQVIVSIWSCNASSLHLFSVSSDRDLSILVNAIIIHRLKQCRFKINEPSHEKTNNVDSEQVRHKRAVQLQKKKPKA